MIVVDTNIWARACREALTFDGFFGRGAGFAACRDGPPHPGRLRHTTPVPPPIGPADTLESSTARAARIIEKTLQTRAREGGSRVCLRGR